MRANNFTVVMMLIVAFTIFIANFRTRRPVENNWPMIYWCLMLFVVSVRPEDTFSLPAILVGFSAGLLLRFEFMNRPLTNVVKVVEAFVWAYIIYRGVEMMFTG